MRRRTRITIGQTPDNIVVGYLFERCAEQTDPVPPRLQQFVSLGDTILHALPVARLSMSMYGLCQQQL